jgi:Mce-associated membrane protein
MGEAKPPPGDSATSKADAMALLEEAEADAAEAEALAAAARARARAARLRREVRAKAEAEAAEVDAVDTDPDADDVDESDSETDEDDVDESDSETDEETVEAAAPESRLARWRRRLPSLSATSKVAAIVLICAFVGASGYMLWYEHHATERQQRAANFVAGAKQGVVNMTSLDFNRAKEDVQRLLDSSTGEFRDDFQQRAKDFVSVVEESKVVTQGTINATAVESMGEHSASILVAATSRITNAAGAKDEARVWRLRVTVTEEGGQYKMSKLEFVP